VASSVSIMWGHGPAGSHCKYAAIQGFALYLSVIWTANRAPV